MIETKGQEWIILMDLWRALVMASYGEILDRLGA